MGDVGLFLITIPLLYNAVLDVRKRLISDTCNLLIIGCGMIRITSGYLSLLDALLALFSVGFLLLFVAVLKKQGMGGGDIKLCACLAFGVGINKGLPMIIASMLIMLFYSVMIKNKNQSLPFAPFAAVGFIILGGMI